MSVERHITRRTFLAGAGGTSLLTAGCSRLSGNTSSSGDGDKTLRWMQFYTTQSGRVAQANRRWLHRVVDQFEQENPGWRVELQGYQWDEIDQRAILDLKTDVPHDVVLATPQLMPKHAVAGTFVDLQPYLDSWDQEELQDLSWSAVWQAASIRQEQIAVPLGVVTRALVYNTEMFSRAGIDPSSALSSMDSFVASANELTGDGRWGVGIYMGSSRASIENTYAPIVWNFHGDFYDSERKAASLTSDASIQAAHWLYDLVHKSQVAAQYSYAPQAQYGGLVLDNLVNGETAQSFGFGSQWIQALERNGLVSGCYPPTRACKPTRAAIAPLPTSTKAAFTNGWMLGLYKNSRHPDKAWRLIETALRPENLRNYPDAGLPARKSEMSSPDFSSEYYRTWLQAAENGRPMPPTAHYTELADRVAVALQQILTKKASVRDAMGEHEQQWNKKYAGGQENP